jgi:hypothetical protein
MSGYKNYVAMELNCVLLDTSFFIRMLKSNDELHKSTLQYYKYFLSHGFLLKISTISIAEYCVKGSITELPLKDLRILPFNLDHAKRAGAFAALVFNQRDPSILPERNIIPNDTKLFAQAEVDPQINFYATSDTRSINVYNTINASNGTSFRVINIRNPHNETFSLLDFPL